MNSRALNYLGIAKKAGLIETGEENSHAAIKKGKTRLLIVASDASENAAKRAAGFVFEDEVPLARVPFQKADIAAITGKTGCSMAALCDAGIASSFATALFEEFGEAFSELSETMKRRLEQEKLAARRSAANSKARKRRKNT